MKKLMCILLYGLCFIHISGLNISAELGDINGDGDVDMADAILTLQILSGTEPSSPVDLTADVDIDGKIGLAEIIYLLRLITIVEPPYFAYVPNCGDGNVSVIDTATHTVIDTVEVPGTYLRGTVAACISSTQVYVLGDYISVINTLTNTVVENFTEFYPTSFLLALNPSGSYLYTTKRSESAINREEVVVIETATNTVATSIGPITRDPLSDSTQITDLVVGPLGNYVYVDGSDATLVSTDPYYQYEYASFIAVIDTNTNTLTRTFPFEWTPERMAVHPSGNFLYVLYSNLDTQERLMAVIDTSTDQIVVNVDLQHRPVQYLALHPDGTKIYGSQPSLHSPNWNPGEVVVINTSNYEIATSIEVGIQPNSLSVNPSGTRIFVVNENLTQDNGSVSVIDTSSNTVIDTLPIGKWPKAVSHQFIARGS